MSVSYEVKNNNGYGMHTSRRSAESSPPGYTEYSTPVMAAGGKPPHPEDYDNMNYQSRHSAPHRRNNLQRSKWKTGQQIFTR